MGFNLLSLALIVSLFIILTFIIIYFSKERLKSKETKIYKVLLISNLIGIILQLLCDFISYNYDIYNNFIGNFILKLLLIYFIFWISILFLYLCNISLKNTNIVNTVVSITFIIFVIAIFSSPYLIYRDIENNRFYGYGNAANLVYLYSAIYTIAMLILLIANNKRLKSKKVIPIFIFIVFGFLSMIIQMIYPYILIPVIVESYICCLLYFTIENPDMKVLEELENNRILIENNNEEKSNLLFKLSQEIRMPIKEIENISYDMLNKKDINDLKNCSKDINIESKNLSLLVDNILDISSMDINKIKLYKNKFDIYKLYNEIILIAKNKMGSNIEFKYNIVNNLPLIYGDSIKLKQIICSILNYSINSIKNGFIELDIDAITNYDMCRLIITIKDNGKYIELSDINDIMSYSNNIEIDDNNLFMSLKEVNSMVKLLNGTFLVKSKKNKENVYRVVIDHEMEANKLFNVKKQVLLIDDNYEELKEYSKVLKLNNVNVTTSMYGNDSINRIRNNEKYDLIIIDDEMQPYNAIKTLEELNNLPKFRTKVVVMLGLNKEFVKDHYLKDYKFTDYLIKRNYKKELERIIDKYL